MIFTLRNFIAVALALLILVAIIWATGGTRSYGTAAPTATPQPEPTSAQIQGDVTVAARKLVGRTWRFRYTVHDIGSTPIAGFQLTGSTANLFHIVAPAGWGYMGSYCGQHRGDILIYWSAPSSRAIQPGRDALFGFDVNTNATITLQSSLAWQNATPQFSFARGPATSRLPAGGRCGHR